MINPVSFKGYSVLNNSSVKRRANSNPQYSQLTNVYIFKCQQKVFFENGTKNVKIKQRQLIDCQLLAFIDALCHNKNGVKIMEKMLQLSPDGKTIYVYFANSKDPITLDFEATKKDYDRKNAYNKIPSLRFRNFINGIKEYIKTGNKDYLKFNPSIGDFGIYALEQAYAKFLDSNLYSTGGENAVINNNDYHGDGYICMKDIIGGTIEAIRTAESMKQNSKNDIPLNSIPYEEKEKINKLLKNVSQNPDKYVVTASTIVSKDKNFVKKFVQWHDYSIRKVDYGTKKLTIVNPWDNSKQKVITFDELMENFEGIVYAQVG